MKWACGPRCFARRSPSSACRPAITTRAPSSTNRSAVHWPAPLVPPATMVTFPSSRPIPLPFFVTRKARRSHRGVAAVDEQQRARHVGGVVGSEKQDAGGNLVGRTVTPEQRALGCVIPVLLERPADRLIALLVKGRVDRPRADRIHPDAVRSVIRRHPSGQSGDRRFGGVVLRGLANARHRPHRGDVDDAAAPGLPEERNRRLRGKRVSLEIDAEDLVPALGASLFHRVIQPDAGVVDEDVEPAEPLRGLANEGRGFGLAFHVRFHEYDLSATRRDLRRDPLAPVGVPVGVGHLRTFLDEPPYDGLADPRGSAGHGRHFPDQSCHARCPHSPRRVRGTTRTYGRGAPRSRAGNALTSPSLWHWRERLAPTGGEDRQWDWLP